MGVGSGAGGCVGVGAVGSSVGGGGAGVPQLITPTSSEAISNMVNRYKLRSFMTFLP